MFHMPTAAAAASLLTHSSSDLKDQAALSEGMLIHDHEAEGSSALKEEQLLLLACMCQPCLL